MKKMISVILSVVMLISVCGIFAGCGGDDGSFTVGICQLMVHDALDQATQGFVDSLSAEMKAAGKTVTFDTQVAGDSNLCATVINTFTAKREWI